jgi:phosphoesterase RecJ-like protein
MPTISSTSHREIIKKISKIVGDSNFIIISSHKNPDPDAIGSILGLWHILKNTFPKKHFWLHNPTFIDKRFYVLQGADQIKQEPPSEAADLVLALDAGSLDRIGLEEYIKKYHPKIIFIDHHEKTQVFADVVWVVSEAKSNSQLIYILAKELNWKIPKEAALALLVGIAGDTLSFSLASSEEFSIASELMKENPNLSEAIRNIFGWQTIEEMKALGKVLSRAKFIKEKRFIWSYITAEEVKDYKLNSGGLAYIANILRNFKEAEVSLFLRPAGKEGGDWEGSLRSTNMHPTNLAELCKLFGGGGHKHAAGFKTNMQRSIILKKILKMLPLRK